MAEGEDVDEGSTMVVTGNGKLCRSERPYDRTAVGVISGAGNLRPGIVLGRRPGRQRRYSLAVAGKVNCKVDASGGPIEVGDLLTTSSRPGHAMKASDVTRSFGAVLGKALASFHEGVGLVPMLVALQ